MENPEETIKKYYKQAVETILDCFYAKQTGTLYDEDEFLQAAYTYYMISLHQTGVTLETTKKTMEREHNVKISYQNGEIKVELEYI
jgi:hypothetical protein